MLRVYLAALPKIEAPALSPFRFRPGLLYWPPQLAAVDGVFSETFPSHDMARRAAERAAKEQVAPGDTTASHTRTRMVVGTMKCRQATIDPRPTSRAEEARRAYRSCRILVDCQLHSCPSKRLSADERTRDNVED